MEPAAQIQSLKFMDKIKLSAKTGFHIFKLFKIAFRTFFWPNIQMLQTFLQNRSNSFCAYLGLTQR